MSFAPQEWSDWLIQRFSDDSNPAYGQVASVDDMIPKVRTVHLHYDEESYKTLIFNTAISSPKWSQLRANPRLSGCFFEMKSLTQFRWEGYAKLLTLETDQALVEKSWNSTRKDLKDLYWENESGTSLNEVCPNFGLVVILPEAWDIYRMHEQDYRLAQRTQFYLEKDGWVKKEKSIVD
jgi:pyridoxine/pyridoxamine 5'-phosphate oxidase